MASKSRQPLKFWKDFNAPVAVAHRGGDAAGHGKENSLAAFKAAYELGYRWFETDVVATKDKKLVVIHGRGWQIRPNKDLPLRSTIRRLTYAEVKQKIKIDGENVILLEELLDKFPGIKIFVDPKTFGSVPVLIKIMCQRPQDIDRVCIGSFSKMRTIRVAYLIKKETGKDVCTSILGPINAYPVYLAARIKFLKPFIRHYVQETNAGSLHVPYRWITNSPKAGHKLINYCHRLGIKIVVYTPNSEKAIKAALEGSVDLIMSDKARPLMNLVHAKHKK
jgi:glycerophosphoryl diester phosphodiesterase